MARGSLSFGYFSLAAQRKVTRRQGGTPTMKVTTSTHKRSLRRQKTETAKPFSQSKQTKPMRLRTPCPFLLK